MTHDRHVQAHGFGPRKRSQSLFLTTRIDMCLLVAVGRVVIGSLIPGCTQVDNTSDACTRVFTLISRAITLTATYASFHPGCMGLFGRRLGTAIDVGCSICLSLLVGNGIQVREGVIGSHR